MSPRPYDNTRRIEGAAATRERILEAARAVLHAPAGAERFSIDAVAREAGVVRATVYYQFHSRAGLIEAFFDHLAARAELPAKIAAAMHKGSALEAIGSLVHAFADLWESDREAIRRVRAMGILDPELGALLSSRNERRRFIAAALVERLRGEGYVLAVPPEQAAGLLWTLSDFEVYDSLAGQGCAHPDVAEAVASLVLRALVVPVA
jgi:AcrR family transcriptional regulator